MHPHEYKKLREASGQPASDFQETGERRATASPARPPPSRAPPVRYLRPPAAAEYLGLSPSTLAKMRLRGDGPPYSKCGPRVVIYSVEDLDGYLASRRRINTSEIGE